MARMRVAAAFIFAACLGVYYYVRMASCLSWLSSVLGFGAMHIVMTALVILVLYLGMPKDPDAQDGVLQVGRWFFFFLLCRVQYSQPIHCTHRCGCKSLPGGRARSCGGCRSAAATCARPAL